MATKRVPPHRKNPPAGSLFETAKTSPAEVFEHPIDVVVESHLSDKEKEDILKQWEADEIALDVAEGEGMGGGTPSKLDEVNKAAKIIDKER